MVYIKNKAITFWCQKLAGIMGCYHIFKQLLQPHPTQCFWTVKMNRFCCHFGSFISLILITPWILFLPNMKMNDKWLEILDGLIVWFHVAILCITFSLVGGHTLFILESDLVWYPCKIQLCNSSIYSSSRGTSIHNYSSPISYRTIGHNWHFPLIWCLIGMAKSK